MPLRANKTFERKWKMLPMEKKKEMVFITVIGEDKKGIVATVATYLYHQNINIIDINQRIMPDGCFVMSMFVDVCDAAVNMEELSLGLEKIGRELAMSVQVQHENIFRMMHRI
ncbi:MAG: ACT domain-containing protein [Desulfobacteraceae bacterium]|nr:ACT domain-containing protein [Desulfobacteraceae bacterium]